MPYEDQLDAVQNAVDSFRENSSGLLPIKTRDMETDQYIKYPIDFKKSFQLIWVKHQQIRMKQVEFINMF